MTSPPLTSAPVTTYRSRIESKLTAALAPEMLRVKDMSHLHAGHAGADPAGETHFAVTIVAAAFEGQSRVARQRRVYEVLAEELRERVHALQLRTLTPDEAARAEAARAEAEEAGASS